MDHGEGQGSKASSLQRWAAGSRAWPSSQVLPVDGHQRLIGLLSVTYDLSNAVLLPQTLDLPVALSAQVEGVPPSEDTHKYITIRAVTRFK